jgi:hypothetical protein
LVHVVGVFIFFVKDKAHVRVGYRTVPPIDYNQWHRLVQVYSSIFHSDSVTVVPSFYLYIRVVGRRKDRCL